MLSFGKEGCEQGGSHDFSAVSRPEVSLFRFGEGRVVVPRVIWVLIILFSRSFKMINLEIHIL